MAIINDRIKERRNELGYTLLYVAEKLDVKEATMQRYESGAIKNIKHETIVKLADILDCNPAYLMGWLDTPHGEPASKNTLSDCEKNLILNFRKLNTSGKDKVFEYMQDLSDNPKYTKEKCSGRISDDIMSDLNRNITVPTFID